jgi:hypothetical protein
MSSDSGARSKPAVGLGVDSGGNPVIDPTANVLALTAAEAKRQDDLRAMHALLQDEKNKCTKEIANLSAKHVRDLADLRADYTEKLALAETGRLDAIRQVDQLAVTNTAAQTLQAIQTLAATTQINAENLRKEVANSAAAIAASNTQTIGQITERLSALEKSSYEGTGRGEGRAPFGTAALTIIGTVVAALIIAAIFFLAKGR